MSVASLVVAIALSLPDVSLHYAIRSLHSGAPGAVEHAERLPRPDAHKPMMRGDEGGRRLDDIVWQGVYVMLVGMASMLLTAVVISRERTDRRGAKHFFLALGGVMVLAVGAVMLFPMLFLPDRDGFSYPPMAVLKCALAAVLGFLISYSYIISMRRRYVEMQNERLKTQNLAGQYQSMITQFNPHFFFNSLNALSALVRKGDSARSLDYIRHLSEVFRYVLAAGSRTMVSVGEELASVEAYTYLLRIRFGESFEISTDVPEEFGRYMLPVLSMQPLIENAVKHNRVSLSTPLRISVRVEKGDARGAHIVVEHNLVPRLSPPESTHIGLTNLCERYRLLTGAEVGVEHTEEKFAVSLPVAPPLHKMNT